MLNCSGRYLSTAYSRVLRIGNCANAAKRASARRGVRARLFPATRELMLRSTLALTIAVSELGCSGSTQPLARKPCDPLSDPVLFFCAWVHGDVAFPGGTPASSVALSSRPLSDSLSGQPVSPPVQTDAKGRFDLEIMWLFLPIRLQDSIPLSIVARRSPGGVADSVTLFVRVHRFGMNVQPDSVHLVLSSGP